MVTYMSFMMLNTYTI